MVAPELRLEIFICRCSIYICSMGILIYHHSRRIWQNIRAKDFITVGRFKVPAHLANRQEIVGLALACFPLVKFALEPILHCMNSGGELDEERCAEGQRMHHECAKVQAGRTQCRDVASRQCGVPAEEAHQALASSRAFPRMTLQRSPT